ncbi:MAG: hypothetical protein ACKO1M_00700 [Planctomycetota bacterium]
MTACGPGVRAVDDQVGVVPDGPQPAETVRFAPAAIPVMGQANAGDFDLGLLFDQQVFGRARTARAVVINDAVVIREALSNPDDGVLGKLAELRGRGATRLMRLEQVCGLSPAQRQAIDLALASDLNRIAGEIDAVRRTYAGQRIARQRMPLEQQRIQALHQDALRCRGLIERAFQQGSLSAAVGIGMLDPDQRRRLADWVTGRRATRWEAMVRLVLGQLDEAALGLSRRQHQALVDLLLAEVPPLAVFDDAPAARDPTSFHAMLVLARLGRAGERAVRPLLDPRQWAELERRMAQAGLRESIERLLVEQGILEAQTMATGEEVP